MRKYKYAIEMGGGFTNIYVKGQGLALKEPTLVAAEPTEEGYKVIALGLDAKRLVGKTKDNIEIFTPCVYGEHSNYEYSVVLLKHLLSKVGFKPTEDNVLFLTPCGITAHEKDNILRVCESVNMGYVDLVPAVICSCVGEGRKIDGSNVHMVVNIGGTYTDIAVINMSNIMKGATLSVGGKSIDASIVNYLAYKDELVIGLPTAEILKNDVGSLYENDTLNMEVMGLDGASNMPKTKIVSCREIRHVFEAFLEEIVRTINVTINTLPPEISADIIKNGVIFTGGVSKIAGLDDFLKRTLTYNFTISDDCENVAILGAGKLLNDDALLKKVLL